LRLLRLSRLYTLVRIGPSRFAWRNSTMAQSDLMRHPGRRRKQLQRGWPCSARDRPDLSLRPGTV